MRKTFSIAMSLAAGAAFLTAPSSLAASAPPGTLVTGTVLGTNGVAASGAGVHLVAWPNAKYLEALPKGAKVPLLELGATRTDGSGHYRLVNSLGAVPARYVEPNGAINFDVSAALEDGTAQQVSGSAAVLGRTAALNLETAVPTDRPASISFNMRQGQITQRVGSATAVSIHMSPTLSAQTTSGGMTPDAAVPTPACTTWAKTTYYPKRTEHFMNLYTWGWATVRLEVGSSQSLGIGFTAGGAWSADGSATITTSSSAAADGDFSSNQQLTNLVNYQAYARSCPQKGGTTRYEHVVRPSALAYLLTSAVHIPDRTWASCQFYSSSMQGKHYSKVNGAGQEFAVGVSLPFMYLNARAAYSQSLSATWTIPSSGEDLCASSTDGWVLSPLVGGRAHPAPGCISPTGTAPSVIKPDC